MKKIQTQLEVFTNTTTRLTFVEEGFCFPNTFNMRFRICGDVYVTEITDKTVCLTLGNIPLCCLGAVEYQLLTGDCIFAWGVLKVVQGE